MVYTGLHGLWLQSKITLSYLTRTLSNIRTCVGGGTVLGSSSDICHTTSVQLSTSSHYV